jgi:hypothetical protein
MVGPLLFLLYLNDILLNIQGVKIVLFADDKNILVVDKMRMLSNRKFCVMKEFVICFQKNDLINIQKTVAVFVHYNQFRHPSQPRALFHDTEISFKPKVRF